MTKIEIVRAIAKETGVDQPTVLTCLEAFMEVAKKNMIEGNDIFLRGFGSFILKQRAEKTARNISKGETVRVPAHKIPAFKPCPEFAKAVAEATK